MVYLLKKSETHYRVKASEAEASRHLGDVNQIAANVGWQYKKRHQEHATITLPTLDAMQRYLDVWYGREPDDKQ